jgi:hypothetical protein
MRLQSKINKMADQILRKAEGYSYIYDPEHRNKPHGNYWETEKGWSNDPKHDPKNQQQPVQPPQSFPTTRINQVTQQFMEGSHKAPTEFLDKLISESVGEGQLSYKDQVERRKSLVKTNDELIDERISLKTLHRGINGILSEIETGAKTENEIVNQPLWKLISGSFSPIVVKSVDQLKEIKASVISKIDELHSKSTAIFEELEDTADYETKKSAHARHLFHRSLFIKPIGSPTEAYAYPVKEEDKQLVSQFSSAIQWASRIIDWKQTNSPIRISFLDREKKRANYDQHSATIKLDETCDDGVYIHELGHHLELKHSGIGSMAKQFYEKRTAGQRLVKLNDLIPWGNYGEQEYGRDDSFIDKYSGKVYEDGTTELVSTGLEHMFRDPVNFRIKDPEHFLFTMAVLRLVRHQQP